MMQNRLGRYLLRQNKLSHPTIETIRELCERMEAVQNRFEMETDPDLIEGCIYEMEAIRAQYRYWLRVARDEGIVCREEVPIWDE